MTKCLDRENACRKISDVEISPETCCYSEDNSSFGGNFIKEFNRSNLKADKKCSVNDLKKSKDDVVYAGTGCAAK